MDDDFDEFTGDIGNDDLLDFELEETQFRSRAYTWPSRPPAFPSPAIQADVDLGQSQLTPLRDVTEAEIAQLQSANNTNHSNNDLPSSPIGGVGAVRKVASRRNAWGNLSYADLITKAIESAPEKRLTLSQVYAWMVANVPFFSDKGDSNSSAGWKNSIRHNLSLHSRFVRVQNEGTGKSSWWMLSSDSISKAPRKRAGTMDAVSNYRRPGKQSKQLGGRPLKSARSTELHPSGSGAATPSEELRKPLNAVPVLNEPSVAHGSSGQSHSFREYRNRSHSGESSAGSGCSPAFEPLACSTTFEPVTSSNWDPGYLSPEPLGLADVFTGSSLSGHHGITDNHQQLPYQQQPQQLQQLSQQQHQIFMTNEAYAHGVPIHRSVPPVQQNANVSAECRAMPSNVGYSSSGGSVLPGDPCMHGSAGTQQQQQQHTPVLSDLLHDKPRPSCLLGSLLMSGGNMTMLESAGVAPNLSADIKPLLPAINVAHPTTPQQQQQQQLLQERQQTVPEQQQLPREQQARRPSQMNQKLLMQLLANKPHLAARVQQLIEAKRRQQNAASMNAAAAPQHMPASKLQMHSELEPVMGHSAMLEQLLTGVIPTEKNVMGQNVPMFPMYDESFPNDLDLSLLDFEATSDIDCDIDQVIQHELAFGDKLDFTFDQLHLDEFANYQ